MYTNIAFHFNHRVPTNQKRLAQLNALRVSQSFYGKSLGSNAEISNRIKEEIRAALDSKELESFSHQIAAGMVILSNIYCAQVLRFNSLYTASVPKSTLF